MFSLSHTTLVMILVVESVRFISCGILLWSLKSNFTLSYSVGSYGPHDNQSLIQVDGTFHMLSYPRREHSIITSKFGCSWAKWRVSGIMEWLVHYYASSLHFTKCSSYLKRYDCSCWECNYLSIVGYFWLLLQNSCSSYFLDYYGPHDKWSPIQVETTSSDFHVLSYPWRGHFIGILLSMSKCGEWWA